MRCSRTYGIELGQDDAVDASRLAAHARKASKRLVEAAELIHRFVADESFADEKHLVGIIDVDELRTDISDDGVYVDCTPTLARARIRGCAVIVQRS